MYKKVFITILFKKCKPLEFLAQLFTFGAWFSCIFEISWIFISSNEEMYIISLPGPYLQGRAGLWTN